MPKGIKGFQKGIKHKTSFKPGINHPNWKGDEVGYKSLHEWVGVNWGKAKEYKCICLCGCKRQALDWANITGLYNREKENWKTLCRSCHRKVDKISTVAARKALAIKRKLHVAV